MQNVSGILDVAIGLVFVYLLLSLICSALTEIMENWFFRCRGKKLYQGLNELFGGSSDFLKEFYQNPLIYGLYQGDLNLDKSVKPPRNLPSYIPPKTFAQALVSQVLGDQPPTVDNLIQQIKAPSSFFPENLKTPVIFLIRSAQGDINAALKNIEDWYSAMGERITGWYKKHAQTVAFTFAALLAVAGNVDTLTIAKSLMVNDQLREQIAVSADQFVRAEAAKTGQTAGGGTESSLCQAFADNAKECYRLQMAKLAELNQLGLPIGWQNCDDPRIWPKDLGGWLEKFFGLLLSAIAISLGAPFWFDVLNKFMNFRASIKPQAQSGASTDSPSRAKTGDSSPGLG